MEIAILSRYEMQDLIDQHRGGELELLAKHKVVSIFDDDGPLFQNKHENLFELNFHDITPGPFSKGYRLFNRAQARQTLAFLLNLKPEDKFLVHCRAGISRSGAVGTFAALLKELDVAALHRRHPRVCPNPWVLSVLMETYQLKLAEQAEHLDALAYRQTHSQFVRRNQTNQ